MFCVSFTGKQIRYTLKGGIRPPWPDDENVIDESKRKPMDKIEDYKVLMDCISDRIITEDELEKTLPALPSDEVKISNINKRWFAGAVGKKRKESKDTRQRSIFTFVSQRLKTDEDEEAEQKQRLEKRKTLQSKLESEEERKKDRRITKKRKLDAERKGDSNNKSEPAVEYKPMHVFPDPNNPEDPITYIATKFMIYGDDEPFLTTVHSLKTATERKELADAVKFRWSEPTVENEWALLSHWTHMITSQMDIEFLWQYNGIGYDIPYMAIRAKYLNCRRFDRLGRFLALPRDELFHKQRYDQCRNRFVARPGRALYRRDENGNEKENEIDFPGVRMQIPGLLQTDVYKQMRSQTFNSLEFGTLKEVAKKYTKCRCKTFVEPDDGTIEKRDNLCAKCGHERKFHCTSYEPINSITMEDKCKKCKAISKAHIKGKNACLSKDGPRKRDLKGVLITPFFVPTMMLVPLKNIIVSGMWIQHWKLPIKTKCFPR